MTDPNVAKQGAFDQIRLLTKDGTEYWRARDLQSRLGYETWENFEKAIARAKEASDKSGYPSVDQFRETTKMVETGSGAQRSVKDYFLSRYASYLIAMNGIRPSLRLRQPRRTSRFRLADRSCKMVRRKTRNASLSVSVFASPIPP